MTTTQRSTTATVETLTAEVRVLMVGKRQITQSVYQQLDFEAFPNVSCFGRVRTNRPPSVFVPSGSGQVERSVVEVVGVDAGGALVRSHVRVPGRQDWKCPEKCLYYSEPGMCQAGHIKAYEILWHERATALPLIVLAGLR